MFKPIAQCNGLGVTSYGIHIAISPRLPPRQTKGRASPQSWVEHLHFVEFGASSETCLINISNISFARTSALGVTPTLSFP